MTAIGDLRALVTGTSSGIGHAVAQRLVHGGAHVHGFDLAPARAEIPGLVAHRGDVSNPDDWGRIIGSMSKDLGGIDALINVAGIDHISPVHETTLDDWNRVLSVNLTASFLGVRAALPELAASRGSIVLVSSVLGVAGRDQYAAYSASKGGLIAFARSLAVEFGPRAIRVNCICPGPIDTPMLDLSDDAQSGSNGLETTKRRTAMGRIGHPDEVASAICYLASREASYITGVVLPVDGGRLAK